MESVQYTNYKSFKQKKWLIMFSPIQDTVEQQVWFDGLVTCTVTESTLWEEHQT